MKYLISDLRDQLNNLNYFEQEGGRSEWEDYVDENWLEDLQEVCRDFANAFDGLQKYYNEL